jgi:adenine-specific DNA methylase
MSTSNTLIDNKRVETLKHTSLHGPTIVIHSTLRLERNNLKQINLCKCDAKIEFEGFVSKEPIHFKMEKWHKSFLQKVVGMNISNITTHTSMGANEYFARM